MTSSFLSNWKEVEFGDVVADSAFGPRFSGDEYADDGNIATLRTTDMSEDGTISYETMPLARLDEVRFSKHFLQQGDLVISRSGRIGTTAVFEGFHLPVLPGAFCIRFRLKECANPFFFQYFFNSPNGRQTILSIAKGTAQQNITSTNVLKLRIPLPPFYTQQRIADILSNYDRLIDNNTRRIALLEESIHRLYKEWFVYLRFPGCDRVKIVDGVPEGWRITQLSEIADVNQRTISARNSLDEIQYVDISSVTTGKICSIQTVKITNAPSRAKRIVIDGDVIWSMVRPGRKAYSLILNPPTNLIVSTGFAVLSAKKIPCSFLYVSVTTESFVSHMENVATGAAYPAVKPKDFEVIPLLIPDDNLLGRFDEFAKSINQQIYNLHLQNEKLREARDLLLPRLMDGSIAV